MKRLLYIILFLSAVSTVLLILNFLEKPRKDITREDGQSILLKEMIASNLVF